MDDDGDWIFDEPQSKLLTKKELRRHQISVAIKLFFIISLVVGMYFVSKAISQGAGV